MFKQGTVRDLSGHADTDLTTKTLRTTDVKTDTLEVLKDAVINCASFNAISTSQLEVTGTLETTDTTVIDLNGNISINNQVYVLTIEDFEKALSTASLEGGLSIFVGPGVFIVSSQLEIPQNTDIRGSGINSTIFRARDGFSDTSLFNIDSNSSIADLQIDGNGGTPRLITIDSESDIQINFVKFFNTTGHMTIIENTSSFVDITNCIYEQKLASGNNAVMIIQGSTNITMDKIRMNNLTNNVNNLFRELQQDWLYLYQI